jgi:uridylate kinase
LRLLKPLCEPCVRTGATGNNKRGPTVARFRRILVKLSGEALMAPDGYWLDPQTLSGLAQDLAEATRAGFEIALVIGGGNIIRGARMSAAGWIDRPTADSMGMLGTVMNSLAIETALNAAGVDARTMSAVSMPTICETYARQPALHHLDKGQVVVLAGGTGNPFFTTDTAAVLRAAELRCDAVLKATQVDGVYSADPKKDPAAIRFDRLTHDEAIAKDLKVMDTAAFALARESRLPIIVGSVHAPSSVTALLQGKVPSTIVAP